jgi:hypothetical protein
MYSARKAHNGGRHSVDNDQHQRNNAWHGPGKQGSQYEQAQIEDNGPEKGLFTVGREEVMLAT